MSFTVEFARNYHQSLRASCNKLSLLTCCSILGLGLTISFRVHWQHSDSVLCVGREALQNCGGCALWDFLLQRKKIDGVTPTEAPTDILEHYGCIPKDALFPCIVHNFWPEPSGPWSKVVHYIGNRAPFRTVISHAPDPHEKAHVPPLFCDL